MSGKYLYAISSCGFVKVGISENPELRAKSINTPDETKVWSTSVQYENAREVEMACHKALSIQNVKGEWFDCNEKDAINTIINQCEKIGIVYKPSLVKEDLNVEGLIATLYNEELIPGTLLRRNSAHRMIYAELVSTYEIDWISKSDLRLIITDDDLFEEIKSRLKGNNRKPQERDFLS